MSSSIAREIDEQQLDHAHNILHTVFGYSAFRGTQADIVAHVSSGHDALVLMPTGGGKSLCYQIPALVREGVGIVVSPLIALMQDQVDALAEVGVRAAYLNSSLTLEQSRQTERQLLAGELDLLYVAPERLLTPRCMQLLHSTRIALFAIDEAHCVSQWGHDFRPEYIRLSVLHEQFPEVPRIALTATADASTRAEIVERLGLNDARQFVSSFDRPNIRYRIVEKNGSNTQLLEFIRNEHAGDAGIVYCLSRKKVDQIAEFLNQDGIKALPYHAGMDNETRARNQSRFLREDGLIVVATIAFGMGIDKPDVRFVAHLDLPKSVEGYYQETGRAGRDGLPANAWMAYGLQDVIQQRRMIEESEADEQHKQIQRQKLDAMLALCETANCRRIHLLDYFGEPSRVCGNCDTCLNPPEVFDATVPLQKLLSTIYRVQQRFAAGHIIDVLCGVESDKVVQWGHNKLSTFAVGADRSQAEWRAILRQAIALELIAIDYVSFNALRLNPDARAVLLGERKISLRRYRKADKSRKTSRSTFAQIELNETERALFEKLRWWRMDAARKHNVPAYIIFHDATLADIAKNRPTTLDALGGINGVGARKLETYGNEIVELLTQIEWS